MTVKTYVDTSALGDTLREDCNLVSLRWTGLDLNRTARSLSKKKLAKLGVGHPHVGFSWQDGDATTDHWIPQGITGLRFGDRKWVVVSWYGKDDYKPKGFRLSFCDVTDMSNVRYRHVLAVEPAEAEGAQGLGVYQPIVMHAGGLAAVGDTLYVVETNAGVRAFDVGRILPAEANKGKDCCGIDASTGKAYAFNYRYILPQTARYELDQGGTSFSYCGIDWSDEARPRLLTGNYHRDDKSSKYYNPPAMLAWWTLDGPRITRLERTLTWDVERVQGAESIGGMLLASRSGAGSGSGGHGLLVGTAEDFQGTKVKHAWPDGCEDLHFSPHSRNLWCLTEHKDGPGRFVFAVRGTDVGV